MQADKQYEQAIAAFKQVAAINKSAWGAEARYEIANCYYLLNELSSAEKAGLEVIKVTGSYDYWVARAYILLGDVYLQQKDYFNSAEAYVRESASEMLMTLPAFFTKSTYSLGRPIST